MTTRATVRKRPGRIRVDEHGVVLVHTWAVAEEQRLLARRREMADMDASTEGHNQLLARVRRIRDEAERTAKDLGVPIR